MTATQSNPTPAATWSIDHLKNIGLALTETAQRMPEAIAVACPEKGQPKKIAAERQYRYRSVTFSELEDQSNQIAMGLQAAGVTPGTRLALMVPPGINFVAHVFGLFKTGVVTILIDPGMGRKNMIQCLSDANPAGIVGIPVAQLARWIFRKHFRNCKTNIVVNGFFPGCINASRFLKLAPTGPPTIESNAENEAAIIFTTGSTGPPKGVLYRHRNFIEQAQQIRDYFQIQPGNTDISGFPLFALFNTAMGTTTVFPEMDPTRPASIFPPNLIDAATQFQAEQSFGSPALWNTVSKYCQQHSIKLPTFKRILTAGAPVSPSVLEQVKKIIADDGDVFTPYGATEALPVACQSATEVLGETAAQTNLGAGTCVGSRFPSIQWRLIKITDQPLAKISDTEAIPQGEIGELIVSGPVVTDCYVTRTDANAYHKIIDDTEAQDTNVSTAHDQPVKPQKFWHRMGDVGYFDQRERFWFCGRKSHRVQTSTGTMFTIPCESIINTHAKVYRSALVGVGKPGEQIPVLFVEPLPEHWPEDETSKQQLIDEVREIADHHWQTDSISRIQLHRSLPVDIRHNSKIFREKLRELTVNE